MTIILHLDMDAFYSAIEVRERPGLKGKPVIVGADPRGGKGRGVVSTCNYEARKFGIRSGMPISKAYKLCPNGAYLPVNMRLYVSVSQKIMKILMKFSKKFEQASVDEAYLDISGAKTYKKAEGIAKKIKQEISKKEKLTCSVGIGPNKMIAKIASDFKKPDGLTIVTAARARKFLEPMSVRKIPGIGPKTEERLNALGIKTVKQLANAKVSKLVDEFGAWGQEFHDAALGHGDEEVYQEEGVKSISRENTFQQDTNDRREIHHTIEELAREVKKDLDSEGYLYRTVTIKARYHDFETFTRAKTVDRHRNDLKTIIDVAKDLFEEFLETKKELRLVGVRVTGLTPAEEDKKEAKLGKWLGKQA